jgi:hypothetical protein
MQELAPYMRGGAAISDSGNARRSDLPYPLDSVAAEGGYVAAVAHRAVAGQLSW